uniref:Ig-like domain-containing protein n=1 Tax=Neovison vison TaxID=452646 RepID=A0A8C7C1H3_NEOVI
MNNRALSLFDHFFFSATGPVEAGVTQTPRHFITRTGRQLTLYCSQDMDHEVMYWYRQDPGVGLKLIYFSRNVKFIEGGDVPDGYSVLRKEKKDFPLTLKSTATNQTSVYLCASSVSTALLSQLLSAQKEHHKSKETPCQAGGKLPPPSVP